jgi:7-carboxy-7-deazaguanine synthase
MDCGTASTNGNRLFVFMRIAEIYHTIQGEGRLTGVQSVFVRTSGCNLRCRFCDTPYASWMPEGDFHSFEEVLAEVERCALQATSRRAPPSICKSAGVAVNSNPFASCGRQESSGLATLARESGDCPHNRSLRHVVITGGEPMLFPDLVPLCAELRRRGKHVTIETAGTRYLPVECDLMAVSPKLSNSTPCTDKSPEWVGLHERNRAAVDVVRRLNAEFDCQFKFVVGSPADCDEVRVYLADFPEIDRRRVLLMPQGTHRAELTAVGQWLEPYCREQGLVFCPRRHIEWFGCCRGT